MWENKEMEVISIKYEFNPSIPSCKIALSVGAIWWVQNFVIWSKVDCLQGNKVIESIKCESNDEVCL